MILDSLAHASRYSALGGGFTRAFEFLRDFDGARPDGRLEIDGEALYATLMGYETKVAVDQTHEAHRRYADIQFILEGAETILFTPPERLGKGNGYHVEKDYELFGDPSRVSMLAIQAGQFAVFSPGEGHKPGLVLQTPTRVRKIVVKIRI